MALNDSFYKQFGKNGEDFPKIKTLEIKPLKVEQLWIDFLPLEKPKREQGCPHGGDIMHVYLGGRCWNIRRQRYEF